ncbi:hypothetical protein MTO96_002512 [Rhipicephalus appendiculatus]
MSRVHVQAFENGSLAINDAKEEDAGFFLCQATNGVGQGLSKVVKVTVHTTCQSLRVIFLEPPDAPQDLKVMEAGSRSVKLEWTAPYSCNSAITHNTVQ